MTASRNQLDAFSRSVQDRNERDRRRWNTHEPAGLPPMPEDSAVCRWCGGRRKLLIAEDPESSFCPNLCAQNASSPYLGQCGECGKDFHTGRRHASVCFSCERKDGAGMAVRTGVERRAGNVTRDDWAERRRA